MGEAIVKLYKVVSKMMWLMMEVLEVENIGVGVKEKVGKNFWGKGIMVKFCSYWILK